MLNRLISIAPMMDCTDRHCRYFLRQMSRHVLLYTEMITTKALLHGDVDRHLAFDASEHPLALQLGGSDPKELAHCAVLAEEYGYDEVNLNVGCPSSRVQSGGIGACLMKEADLVAECVATMQAKTKIPVTVKTRIGVDEFDSYEFLHDFVTKISATGCDVFIIHARKAWLKGLSPKQNRTVPPLCYDVVHQLKKDFPQLTIVLNGGVKTLDEVEKHLLHVDGVMIGREAYANPELLLGVDQRFFNADNEGSAADSLRRILPYLEKQLAAGVRLSNMTRHLLGLFQGKPGARSWRRYLSEHANKKCAGIEVVQRAASFVELTL